MSTPFERGRVRVSIDTWPNEVVIVRKYPPVLRRPPYQFRVAVAWGAAMPARVHGRGLAVPTAKQKTPKVDLKRWSRLFLADSAAIG